MFCGICYHHYSSKRMACPICGAHRTVINGKPLYVNRNTLTEMVRSGSKSRSFQNSVRMALVLAQSDS